MKQEITIRKEKVNWLKIIDVVLKKKDWGKNYVIYTAGSTTITCMLREYNFEDQTAWFRLKIDYINKDSHNSEISGLIRYVTNHFTPADFKMHLNKRLTTMLNELTEKEERNAAEKRYSTFKFWRYNLTPKDFKTAGFEEDYNKILSLDDSLQYECLDALKDKTQDVLNEPFDMKVEAHMKKHPFKGEGIEMLKEMVENE